MHSPKRGLMLLSQCFLLIDVSTKPLAAAVFMLILETKGRINESAALKQLNAIVQVRRG